MQNFDGLVVYRCQTRKRLSWDRPRYPKNHLEGRGGSIVWRRIQKQRPDRPVDQAADCNWW